MTKTYEEEHPNIPYFGGIFARRFAGSVEDNQPAPAQTQSPISKTDEESPVKSNQEKAAPEKRLSEIDAELHSLARQRGVGLLGMTLVDPSEKTLELSGFRKDSPLPMITGLNSSAYFPVGMTPYKGCTFWIVESPAKGFIFNGDTSASYRPRNVHELIEAIVACTVTPEEYQKLYDRCNQAAEEYFKTLTNSIAERKRLHRIVPWEIPTAYAGKYVCRVVYDYPHKAGTMTTDILMTRKDLDQLRELLKKDD